MIQLAVRLAHEWARRAQALVAVVLLAAAVAACTVPALQREPGYPAGWPDIAGAAGCSALAGTYLNQGVLIDQAGQAQPVWLTSLLPFSQRVPAVAERQARDGLRACARVTLQVEDRPWPDAPGRQVSKLVVAPSRQASAGASAPWEACAGFELPQRRGWPFEDDLAAGCGANHYVLSMNPGQIVYDVYDLQLASGADGSLVVKWRYGAQFGADHVWVRFARVP